MTWQMMLKLGSYKMTIIDLPMNIVYGVCMLGLPPCSCARSGSCVCTAPRLQRAGTP
jgi:hypothetical protein